MLYDFVYVFVDRVMRFYIMLYDCILCYTSLLIFDMCVICLYYVYMINILFCIMLYYCVCFIICFVAFYYLIYFVVLLCYFIHHDVLLYKCYVNDTCMTTYKTTYQTDLADGVRSYQS